MFWQKKPKKKPKPSNKQAAPVPKPSRPDPPHPPKPKPEKIVQKVDARKEFLRVFRQLTYRHNPWNAWQDFVTMSACALSNPVDKQHYDEREALYMKTIKRYSKQEQNLFPELFAHTVMALDDNPEQDFLGSIFMELNLENDAKGQVFTPYHVCQLMAEIAMDDTVKQVNEKGYFTINDPACGAGATLIAGIHAARKALEKENLNFQNHILVVAQDIDWTVALMCYIQLSLLGVAGCVKIGNSLTEPMTSNDSKENYWFTPMYFSKVWTMRRLFHNYEFLKGEERNE